MLFYQPLLFDQDEETLFGGAVHTKQVIKDILSRKRTPVIDHFVNSVVRVPVVNKSTYQFVSPEHTSQADLIYYPQGSTRFKYLLIIIDVVSRFIAAQPLANKEAPTIVEAFRKIFNSGFRTKLIYTDSGTEFNNRLVKNFLNSRGIEIYYTVPGRHNQLAIVDAYTGLLNEILVGIHSYRDLLAKQQGRQRSVSTYNWVENLPLAVAKINESTSSDKRFNKPISEKIDEYRDRKMPIIGENERVLKIGTRVYPPYLAPTDVFTGKRVNQFERGKFRRGDIRYSVTKPYTVGFVSIRLGQPIRYLLKNPDGELDTSTSYLRKELQLAK